MFDNEAALLRDTRIRAATSGNLHLILTQNYWYGTQRTSLYRPLTTISYLVNYAILGGGGNPVPYHWVNFGLHALNIALVYCLALLLLAEIDPGGRLAFALAAVWMLHPALTESVTNIVGRADLLAGFGVLAGLLCHIRFPAADGRRRTVWLVALALASAIGIFSKESGIVVLAAMALYDIAFQRSKSPWALAPGYLAAGIPVALFLALRARLFAVLVVDPVAFSDNPIVAAGFWTGRLTAIKVLGKYLWLLVWPMRLSCDYSYSQVPVSGFGDWGALVSLGLCLGAAGVAIACRRAHKPVFFFIAFFFAALAPTTNLAFPIGTVMAERFLYLPAMAFTGCVVLALRAAGRLPRFRSAGTVALVVICSAFAVRTYARNFDWSDNISLWSSAVAAAPESYKTHMNMAASWIGHEEHRDDAVREVDRAVAILDPLPDSRNNAGVYALAGRWYRVKGDAQPPGQGVFWYRKALAALLRGRRIDLVCARESAQRNRILGKPEVQSGAADVYLELGRIYQRLGDAAGARETLEYGRSVGQTPKICVELAHVYRAAGEPERSAITLMEALSLDPEQTSLVAELVDLYRQLDPQGCAVTARGGPATLNLDCPLVRQHLCASASNVARLYRGSGRVADAETIAGEAQRGFGCPLEMLR